MSHAAFKEWYLDGLKALISANEVGKHTTKKLLKYVTSPKLKSAIDEGTSASARHAEVISKLFQQAGGKQEGMKNEIMEGIDLASDKIADSDDKDVRDAGVISSAQIALHYYIASYGSLAATAKHLGMLEQAKQFTSLCDEVKQADAGYTKIAEGSITE